MNLTEIKFTPRRAWIAGVALLIMVGLGAWWILSPSLADREKAAAEAEQANAVSQAEAKARALAGVAELERQGAHPAGADEATASRLDALQRQIDAGRAERAQLRSQLASRTAARSSQSAGVVNLSEPDLERSVLQALGKVGDGDPAAEWQRLALPDGSSRMVPSKPGLERIVRLGLELDQARDEAATAQKDAVGSATEAKHQEEMRAQVQTRLDQETKHSEQLFEMAKTQAAEHVKTLAELKVKSDAEGAAKDAVIKKLKGNAFWNAVKTGTKIGVGIGIGVAIGRVL